MIHSLPCQLHPPSPEQERLASQTRTNRAACRDSEFSPISLKIAVSARKLGVHGTQLDRDLHSSFFKLLFRKKNFPQIYPAANKPVEGLTGAGSSR
jgi:hypothetical protein